MQFAQKKYISFVCKKQILEDDLDVTSGCINHITILSVNVQQFAFLEIGY